VRHAEERFTWENYVAGVSVGGAVPLLWRGCQWGCLDFLDESELHSADVDMEALEDVQAELNEDHQEAVQLVTFSSAEFDVEDFGDEN
jgi:hypothetical protein